MARFTFMTSEPKDTLILGSNLGYRTLLAVSLLQQGELIGRLIARRSEVRPFTPAQIKLLETFADQAVIALENVRLFQELKEALEQQTATSEILGVIASSPTDINRCWMPWLKMRPEFVERPMLRLSCKSKAVSCERSRAMDRSREVLSVPSSYRIAIRLQVECLSTAKRFIFMISWKSLRLFRKPCPTRGLPYDAWYSFAS